MSEEIDLLKTIRDLEAEIGRLKRGDLTPEEVQNLCHNLHEKGTVTRVEFEHGCYLFQEKLFGPKGDKFIAFRQSGEERWIGPFETGDAFDCFNRMLMAGVEVIGIVRHPLGNATRYAQITPAHLGASGSGAKGSSSDTEQSV